MDSIVDRQNQRYCVQCKTFIDIGSFAMKKNRNTCRVHYNKAHMLRQAARWEQHPIERKARMVWQLAYTDCHSTFHVKLALRVSEVLKLMKDNNHGVDADVRIIPFDPRQAVSTSNFCLTDASRRFDMCFIWRKVKSAEDYMACFKSEFRPTVFASPASLCEGEASMGSNEVEEEGGDVASDASA